MLTTPIISADLQSQVDRAIAQYKHADKYKAWGLSTLREMGACILLEGPPGTGKTTLAHYIALRIRKKGLKEINFADFGSQVPGEGARQIRRLFKEANDNGGMTILLDECESMLWSRDRIAGSNTWMLEIIDEILVQIAKYRYLMFLATNRADMLDAAVMRRLIARIHIGLPDRDTRVRLWKDKWPNKYPLRLEKGLVETLAEYEGFTGSTIERIILNASARAMEANRIPKLVDFIEECQDEQNKIVKAAQSANMTSQS